MTIQNIEGFNFKILTTRRTTVDYFIRIYKKNITVSKRLIEEMPFFPVSVNIFIDKDKNVFALEFLKEKKGTYKFNKNVQVLSATGLKKQMDNVEGHYKGYTQHTTSDENAIFIFSEKDKEVI